MAMRCASKRQLHASAVGPVEQVRRKLIGPTEASYSQYTCYTGIADFTPPDIDTVGYRVFLGNGRYFVSSDVGGGKMQWYESWPPQLTVQFFQKDRLGMDVGKTRGVKGITLYLNCRLFCAYVHLQAICKCQ